jgi:hypothetical protein
VLGARRPAGVRRSSTLLVRRRESVRSSPSLRASMMAARGTVSAARTAVSVVSVIAAPIGGTVGVMTIRAAIAESRTHGMRAVRECRPVVIRRAMDNSWGIVTG